MDEHMHDDFIVEIKEIAKPVAGVIEIEKCYVRKTGMTFNVDMHIVVDGNLSVTKGHDIAHEVKNEIQKKFPEIADVLIHVEPAE